MTQDQNQKPHIIQFVRCNQCGKSMQFYSNTDTQSIYRDSAGHIRKLPRPGGQRIRVQGPNSAA